MTSLGVGMLGFGFMGRTHAYAYQTIPFYYDPPEVSFRLVSVCTAHEDTARAAAELAGFARHTTDYREVVEADDVDVVHVCTPNRAHAPAIKAAVRAGKHIYCEKPVTGDLAEADELEAVLAGYDKVTRVVTQNRFQPATIRARQLVEEGFLGRVSEFRAAHLHSSNIDPNRPMNWKASAAAGGGVIRDLGPHAVDILMWLVGPMAEVSAAGSIWANQRPSKDDPGRTVTVDAEDSAVLMLRTGGGAVGTAAVSKLATGTEDEFRFEIHGARGAMRYNLMQPSYLEVYDGRLADGEFGGQRGWQRVSAVHRYAKPGGSFPGPKFPPGWLRGHVHSLYAFLRGVAFGEPTGPTLIEGLYLQRVLEAACESMHTRQWVDLPAPPEGAYAIG